MADRLRSPRLASGRGHSLARHDAGNRGALRGPDAGPVRGPLPSRVSTAVSARSSHYPRLDARRPRRVVGESGRLRRADGRGRAGLSSGAPHDPSVRLGRGQRERAPTRPRHARGHADASDCRRLSERPRSRERHSPGSWLGGHPRSCVDGSRQRDRSGERGSPPAWSPGESQSGDAGSPCHSGNLARSHQRAGPAALGRPCALRPPHLEGRRPANSSTTRPRTPEAAATTPTVEPSIRALATRGDTASGRCQDRGSASRGPYGRAPRHPQLRCGVGRTPAPEAPPRVCVACRSSSDGAAGEPPPFSQRRDRRPHRLSWRERSDVSGPRSRWRCGHARRSPEACGRSSAGGASRTEGPPSRALYALHE